MYELDARFGGIRLIICYWLLVDLYKTARPFDVSVFSSRGSIDTKMTLAKVAFTLANLVAVGSSAKNVADGFVAAPYYPAPYGGWDEAWVDSYARAKKMVDSMTLAEKTNITAGTGLFMGKKKKSRVR